jgi:hypothetical protein
LKDGVLVGKGKLAFESMNKNLLREIKRMENLTQQLIYKEKELLFRIKILKEKENLKNSDLEHRGLLDEEEEEQKLPREEQKQFIDSFDLTA